MSDHVILPSKNEPVVDEILYYATREFYLENPGLHEDIFRKSREVLPQYFDGFKFSLFKPITSSFQVSHNILISNATPCKYSFGATCAGQKQVRAYETFPVLISEIDGSGILSGQVIHSIGKKLRLRANIQSTLKSVEGAEFNASYFGKTYTASAFILNPDILSLSSTFVTQYLKKVTPTFDIGSEFVGQYNNGSPTLSAFSVSVKKVSEQENPYRLDEDPDAPPRLYPEPKWTLAGSFGFAGLHMLYHQHVSPGCQMIVEHQQSSVQNHMETSFGYAADFKNQGVNVHGSIDSSWTVVSVVEKKLETLPLSFALSVALNYNENRSALGFGISIGNN